MGQLLPDLSGVLFPAQRALGSRLSLLWYSCHITGGGMEQLHTAENAKAEGGGEGDYSSFSLL